MTWLLVAAPPLMALLTFVVRRLGLIWEWEREMLAAVHVRLRARPGDAYGAADRAYFFAKARLADIRRAPLWRWTP